MSAPFQARAVVAPPRRDGITPVMSPNAAGSMQIVRAEAFRRHAHEAGGEGALCHPQGPTAGHQFPWRRREQIGLATLYLGDCREIMPHLQADVICTDPVWPNCPANSVPGWDDPWGLWRTACSVMPASKRIVVVMRCDSDPRFLTHLPPLPFLRSMQLPYVMPGYLGRVLGGDETAYWYGEPIKRAPGRMVIPGRGPRVQPGGRQANGHPMSRAQKHFDWLVGWCADAGETTLDPFMGSGTTGVAAVKQGLQFVGIEIEPRFFDIACRRIEEAQRQGDLLGYAAT